MDWSDFTNPAGRKAILAYLALWGASVAYLALRGGDWIFPIVSLVLFGITLSAVGCLLTRRIEPHELPVANPKRESLGLLAYLAVYAVVLIGIGLGSVKALVPEGQAQEVLVLVYKLAIHVGLPVVLILLLGGAVRPLFAGARLGRHWWVTLIVFAAILFGLLSVVSPSLKNIAATGTGWPAALPWVLGAWIWVSIEAGLCEEFLFRACLQSRIAAWTRWPMFAILAVSVVFALAHWPGLYLRGGPDVDGWSTDPLQVAAFTIATLSPLSILFGLLWQRTRSLLLVVLLHGAVDALPSTVEFIGLWK